MSGASASVCGSHINEGCTKAVMLLHGFTAEQLAELVRDEFAATTIERVVGGAQTSEVEEYKITEAGQRALDG